MSMIAFIKGIWKVMDILAFMSRELGRSVMDVEFFISKTGMKNCLFPDSTKNEQQWFSLYAGTKITL